MLGSILYHMLFIASYIINNVLLGQNINSIQENSTTEEMQCMDDEKSVFKEALHENMKFESERRNTLDQSLSKFDYLLYELRTVLNEKKEMDDYCESDEVKINVVSS